MARLPFSAAARASNAGNSVMHGAHHDAQKCRMIAGSCMPARCMALPSKVLKAMSGAAALFGMLAGVPS